MTKEVNLQIPDSLFLSLTEKAEKQGVSTETLCISLLSEGKSEEIYLVEPSMYQYLANGELRKEIQKVLKSSLAKEEVKKRVRGLENQIVRCIR